jgi:hypothetical protein
MFDSRFVFKTDSWHTYGYKLCSSTRRIVPLFLYLYDADEKELARCFNFTFCYIDDVLSLDNSRFGDFVDRIYPIELVYIGLLHTLTYTSKLTTRGG